MVLVSKNALGCVKHESLILIIIAKLLTMKYWLSRQQYNAVPVCPHLHHKCVVIFSIFPTRLGQKWDHIIVLISILSYYEKS